MGNNNSQNCNRQYGLQNNINNSDSQDPSGYLQYINHTTLAVVFGGFMVYKCIAKIFMQNSNQTVKLIRDKGTQTMINNAIGSNESVSSVETTSSSTQTITRDDRNIVPVCGVSSGEQRLSDDIIDQPVETVVENSNGSDALSSDSKIKIDLIKEHIKNLGQIVEQMQAGLYPSGTEEELSCRSSNASSDQVNSQSSLISNEEKTFKSKSGKRKVEERNWLWYQESKKEFMLSAVLSFKLEDIPSKALCTLAYFVNWLKLIIPGVKVIIVLMVYPFDSDGYSIFFSLFIFP